MPRPHHRPALPGALPGTGVAVAGMLAVSLVFAGGVEQGEPDTADETGGATMQPAPGIDISARDSSYDLRSGVWRFEGEVVIRRGDLLIEADTGTVHQRDGEVERVELEGAPVRWRERLADGTGLDGEAQRLEYDVIANVLTLRGRTRVRHPQGEFSGDRLVYDVGNEKLLGHGGDDERVRMTIEPGESRRDDR